MWARGSGRCVRLFHFGSGRALWRVVGSGWLGGPRVAWNSWFQAGSHGQRSGRWIRSRRADRASRAGTLISWARIVPVVALAWKVEASVPAARVRLNAIAASTSQALAAIAASTSQALLAGNDPSVIWGRSGGVHDVHDTG